MASVYPTAAGSWSTRTWFDVATGALYSLGTPQTGDIVHANGLGITIDINISVLALSTRANSPAGGSGTFSTSGTRIVNADTYAGNSTCLNLTAGSGSIQNGNSYGSLTNFGRYGTSVGSSCIHNGNSYGGNQEFRGGTTISSGGIQNGNSFGGSWLNAHGTYVLAGGIHFGNANGGSVFGSHGTHVLNGGMAFIETATGNTNGAFGVFSDATSRCVAIIKNESGVAAKSLTVSVETIDTNVPFLRFFASNVGGLPIGRLISGGV